mmetsp:Transcript_20939/g.52901  ORF Transcript_20939/g.52901 Transcript_20939/m.52901 type:complete len:107 (-) Transcript_20939:173-493(-)|eukprot:CAMPEP_0178985200 /NCGR_PEP_ID=MMETSP0795-20121207/2022_1 /TAXON_ID=88552 /ORGANISM="Amoebophrya sp., Strain Ameob2" /LENGTH=106 /DNA_ID=CAMNT_0020676135 /DNA_START=47 /DNA_END=367 /DNA_ORIENTATION=-
MPARRSPETSVESAPPEEAQGPAAVGTKFLTAAQKATLRRLHEEQLDRIQKAHDEESPRETIDKPVLLGTLLTKTSTAAGMGKIRPVFPEALPERHLGRIMEKEFQ